MQKSNFVLIAVCLLAGCAEIEVQDGSAEGGTTTYKGLPVAINVRGTQALPVELKTEINSSIPVKLDVSEGSSVPVEIKLSKNVITILSIAGGIVLLIAVICFFAAIAAAGSAKAVSRSVDAFTKTRQESESEKFNNLNG